MTVMHDYASKVPYIDSYSHPTYIKASMHTHTYNTVLVDLYKTNSQEQNPAINPRN